MSIEAPSITSSNNTDNMVLRTPVEPFSRMRHNISNGELENIQADLRKTLSTLSEIQQRLQTYADNLKTTIDGLSRGVG